MENKGGVMKLLWSTIAFTAIILISGCSNPVYVQRDESANLAKYKTYMWVETRKDQNNNDKTGNFSDISIRNAVNAELANQGWKEVNLNPDAFISYDVLVEKSSEQQSNPVYSQPYSRVYYNPFSGRWVSVFYPSQFLGYETVNTPVKEGTITISMIDAGTDKTVWQAWTTEQMNNSRFTPDEISKGVRNIFKKFDVASR
jgi:hypothetical protein